MPNPAPRPGSTRRIKNPQPINCKRCGQVHAEWTVWVTMHHTRQGIMIEFDSEYDCPNEPLPPAPPPVDKHADGKTAQERSDAMFNTGYKPYGF